MSEEKKPVDCFKCGYFGVEHLLSGKAQFPSLCEKNRLWFECKGKYGVIKDV